jgi:tRNA(Ile)-lysidine synthase
MLQFERFQQNIQALGLTEPGKKVLLAISGGIDSIVMMHLFHRAKFNCSIAHCNFQLRDKESDGDETFIREQCANLSFQVFVSRFETREYAAENHLSIQMAARQLRYAWFDNLAKAHQFDFIAVAHNRDDSLETFFINLGRGTGIGGLTGIPPISGNIVRPLMFASRSHIEQYAAENNISHREDSSNASDKYLRNYIRHKIIPAFEEVFPHFRESQSQNLEKLNDANLLYQHAIHLLQTNIVREENHFVYIDIPLLLQSPAPQTLLFEILRRYSFSSASIDEIFQIAQAIPGKQFCSSTHKLIKDRDCYIISKLEHEHQTKYYIEEHTPTIHTPIHLTFEKQIREGFTIEKDPAIAQLDYEKLAFPLILRKWQAGDYFVPLGMKGMKKLSDFFIDLKISVIEKEHTWLLTSADQIVWIVGKRIDDRFKIMDTTENVLKIVVSI